MTLARAREIAAALRSPDWTVREGVSPGDMRAALLLLVALAGIDASDADLDGLTERALAATPGPWETGADEDAHIVYDPTGCDSIAGCDTPSNAAHIAGAHPAAVLALVARCRREMAIAAAERALRVACDEARPRP